MDAGLAALGQGWPFAAARRINVGLRVCRAPARYQVVGQGLFGYFWGCLPKVTRRKGGTLSSHNHENGYAHKNYSIKDNSHHTIKHRAANPAE
jgi:hypothetical protein